ncbi:MAG: diaminopimelate decarboxylase, partial [Bacillota bacterium]
LVDEFDTPLIVLDEKEIRDKIDQYIEGLSSYPGDSKVLYASKAFANRTLYRIFEEKGISLDVVSGGELYTALKADFPAKEIFFHGNNKLPSEIELALKNNIGGFIVDNFPEAKLLNELAEKYDKNVEVMIRLTPGIAAHTHDFMVTGKVDSKFGVGIKNGDAEKLVELISNKYKNLELKGIHAHIGSQIYKKESFLKLIEIMVKFMADMKDKNNIIMTKLDLGGGLGIPHTEDDPLVPIKKYVKEMVKKVLKETNNYNYPLPELLLEPGRSIIGTAGTTLYEIGMIKDIKNVKKYITINGGMSDNIRPSLYGAEYDAFLANKMNEKGKEEVSIAGKCCETGDILIKDITLPESQRGDILAVTCTGAYTYALSNNYNGIPRPAIVLVNQGKANLIVERESYEDLINHDVIPAGY